MEECARLIKNVLHELFTTDVEVQLSRPEPKFGDLATNVALTLAKPLGQNPRAIAEQIAEKLREAVCNPERAEGSHAEIPRQDPSTLLGTTRSADRNDKMFKSVTVAGAGFINLRLADDYLAHELNAMITTDDYGRPKTYQNKVVVTEYSDPNPFKVLHVGHLYTSVVGDAISNLIELAGGQVHRVNFGGDVGLHVAKTMYAIIKELGGENPDQLKEIPESEQAEWLGKCYVAGTRAYEDDPAAKAAIIKNNKKIYELFKNGDKDSPFAQIYWTCRTWSYDYFDAFYDRIGSKFEKYYPESQTAELGLKTVLDHPEVYTKSGQAIIFDGEKFGLHTRVFVNSEGLPTYEAKDVGLSMLKWQDYHFDQSVIITANEQLDYMAVVIKSIAQFAPNLAERTLHLTHGLVKLVGAEKMSSRKGNFLRAVDMLDLVADEYRKVQGQADDVLVLGAIKYAFLKNRLGADLVFEPRESINMTGNSGSYLQYSFARACSVLRKIDFQTKDFSVETPDFDDFERPLMVKLTEWPEVLTAAVDELAPHLVCTYLYELAQIFNRFYENSRVAGDPRAAIRAALVTAYADILRKGLGILGITAPEKM